MFFKEVFLKDHYDINFLVKNLSEKPVIVDIGANAGYFSILMLTKFLEAKLYCFEPIPANHQVLLKNLYNNLGSDDRIKIYECAVVGKKVDKLSMYYTAKDSFSISASRFNNFDHNKDPISVKTITLEEIVSSVKEKVDLLKLDCEGGEYDIIYETSIGTFDDVKQIVMEVHDLDKQKNNITGMSDYLNSLDFKTRHHPIDRDSHVLNAWRNS